MQCSSSSSRKNVTIKIDDDVYHDDDDDWVEKKNGYPLVGVRKFSKLRRCNFHGPILTHCCIHPYSISSPSVTYSLATTVGLL